ncbi:MAG TPA: MFS transporter [Streptosporangiaceae bacterium]
MPRPRLRADLTPLRTSRDFRLLYVSRTVIALGTQATEVALLVQAKQLTGSTVAVGLLGAVELVPLVVFGLYGGVLADRFDRRRLILACEAALGCCAALLMLNALAAHPLVWPLYVVTGLMMAAAALQRPSLDASLPRMVPRDQLTAAAALLSMSQNVSFLAGTTLGGFLAAGPGPEYVYGLDTVSFVVSFCFLWLVRPLPAPDPGPEPVTGFASGLRSIAEGFAYARGRQDLLGSYLADLAAMTLAYPNALFPFVAADLHAPWAVGLMFAAPAAGALAITVVSGWMGRVRRHGLAIAASAAVWGLLITAFGLAPDIAVALGCLVLAGAADMTSGIFRDTLWNQTIPDRLRGRMAGLELLSYGVGPSAGQIRAGAVASVTSARFSLASGGLFCAGAVGLVCLLLPGFTGYRAQPSAPSEGSGR